MENLLEVLSRLHQMGRRALQRGKTVAVENDVHMPVSKKEPEVWYQSWKSADGLAQ